MGTTKLNYQILEHLHINHNKFFNNTTSKHKKIDKEKKVEKKKKIDKEKIMRKGL